jgi:ATP-binding cassette subfamily B protein
MGEAPAVADRPGAVSAPTLRGEVVFEGVSVASPRPGPAERRWSLSDMSFAIRAGQRVGIVGGNGAGKSTLLRLALRLSDPTTGQVFLDGCDLRDYTIVSLRDQISAVFQTNVFFGLTVRENIALGDGGATLEQVRAAARRARADSFIERLPLGYDTPVQHRGGVFSGGEQQRIALARALLRNGRVWLLDEPTTGLDAATAAELIGLLLEATEGRTVLWVTHDPGVLPLLDYVLALDAGRLAFAGSPDAYKLWLSRRVA